MSILVGNLYLQVIRVFTIQLCHVLFLSENCLSKRALQISMTSFFVVVRAFHASRQMLIPMNVLNIMSKPLGSMISCFWFEFCFFLEKQFNKILFIILRCVESRLVCKSSQTLQILDLGAFVHIRKIDRNDQLKVFD